MDYTRQIDILDPQMLTMPITLIGCGGIGSHTAVVLGKMGFPAMSIYDPESVEEINISCQHFRRRDAGKSKACMTEGIVEQFTECQVDAYTRKYDDNCCPKGIVVSGVDTTQARTQIWKTIKNNPEVQLYVDGRLGGELLEVFTIRPYHVDDIEFYEQFLFTSDQVVDLPCTAQNIVYMGYFVAAYIASQIAKFLRKALYFKRVNLDVVTLVSVQQEPVNFSF